MPDKKESSTERKALFQALSFAWDLGWIIAVPAVAFGVGGAYLDKWLGTSPLFLIGGFSLAFITSAFTITKKIKLFDPPK